VHGRIYVAPPNQHLLVKTVTSVWGAVPKKTAIDLSIPCFARQHGYMGDTLLV